jgi:FtsP/CotA-like multicopper oxidase with cupredoxin domain
VHRLRFRPSRLSEIARKNRQEIVRARLGRRDLLKLGLLTSAGHLVPVRGLSASCDPGECELGCSPPTTAFLDPLPIMPVLPERQLSELVPAPTDLPNTAINPATGLPFEGRTERHQFRDRFPPQKYFITRMRPNPAYRLTSDARIPEQLIWGFTLGGAADPGIFPGPTIVTRYETPVLIRRINELTPDNGGFGLPSVSTHLHNFHSGPDSDGGPCDPNQGRFFEIGQYYDYFHTMKCAGFDSTHPPDGDVRESLGTLWYHDHRVDNTAPNVYKGLAGFNIAFNAFDTGDEGTGFHLPSFPQFDIPLFLADKLIDPGTGLLCFDLFGLDGLVGDKYTVNGKIQPFMDVQKRRYRFRILDGGPSRFYQLHLTNPDNPNQQIPFHVLANDGNLLNKPVQVTNVRVSVAERIDIIIDFKWIAQTFGATRLWLENRWEQDNGRGPKNNILPPGQLQNALLEFRLVGNPVSDGSVDPVVLEQDPRPCVFEPCCLPTTSANDPNAQPRITRTFRFERGNGQWQINGQLMNCNAFRFTVQRNSIEHWVLQNNSGGWQHPIHIHLEEFQILTRNGKAPSAVERSRKDVVRLGTNEEIKLFFRFRDFRGGYPMHCHNTIHEDHQMMLIWDIQNDGDDEEEP